MIETQIARWTHSREGENGLEIEASIRDRLLLAGVPLSEGGKLPYEDVGLPLAELQFDFSYQRPADMAWVRAIIRDFEPILFDPPWVNWREDGQFFVMDGQHRVLVMRQRLIDVARPACMCRLFVGLSARQEAMIFGAQDFRKKVSPINMFHAGVKAGREPYSTVSAVTEHAGWSVSNPNQKIGGLQATFALVRIYEKHGAQHLYDVLGLLRECFGTREAPPGFFIAGFSQFLAWYRGDFDAEELIRRLRTAKMSGVRSEADHRRLVDRVLAADSVSMSLVSIFNQRRRVNRLDAWETKRQRRQQTGQRGSAPRKPLASVHALQDGFPSFRLNGITPAGDAV